MHLKHPFFRNTPKSFQYILNFLILKRQLGNNKFGFFNIILAFNKPRSFNSTPKFKYQKVTSGS